MTISVAFWVLCALSTAGPSFEYFAATKALLLAVDVIILAGSGRNTLRVTRRQIIVIGYCVGVALWCSQWDLYSQRLIYNLFVIIMSAMAARHVAFSRREVLAIVLATSLSLIYRYFNYINLADGKHQVHQQVLVLGLLCCFLTGRMRLFGGALAGLFDIRSVAFAYIVGTGTRWRGVLSVFVLSLASFGAVAWAAITWRSLAFFDSLRWRLELWEGLFSSFSLGDWLVGRGLGYSWRQSGELDIVGFDLGSTVASHSNYVKILADTGAVGLVFYLFVMSLLFRLAGPVGRGMLLIYIGYGFFDEGIWGFNILWCFVVVETANRACLRGRASLKGAELVANNRSLVVRTDAPG